MSTKPQEVREYRRITIDQFAEYVAAGWIYIRAIPFALDEVSLLVWRKIP